MAKSPFKKQTIMVYSSEDRAKTIQIQGAYVAGDFAVHPSTGGKYSIALTHVPSGVCIWDFDPVTTLNGTLTSSQLLKQVKAAALLCGQAPKVEVLDADGQIRKASELSKVLRPWREIVTKARSEKLFEEKLKEPQIVEDFQIPERDIRWLVGQLHVGTSDREVAKEFFRRCKSVTTTKGKVPVKLDREQRKAIVRFALKCHRENRALYRDVVRGEV